jgi:hypothetical protein
VEAHDEGFQDFGLHVVELVDGDEDPVSWSRATSPNSVRGRPGRWPDRRNRPARRRRRHRWTAPVRSGGGQRRPSRRRRPGGPVRRHSAPTLGAARASYSPLPEGTNLWTESWNYEPLDRTAIATLLFSGAKFWPSRRRKIPDRAGRFLIIKQPEDWLGQPRSRDRDCAAVLPA